MTPEELWEKFIEHLNKVQPLDKTGTVQHKTFFGSIESYKKVFLEATKNTIAGECDGSTKGS